LEFALNHMSVARMGFAGLLRAASELGCIGVEVRTDLPGPLFDGMSAGDAGALARDAGLRLLALAEVSAFDDWTSDRRAQAQILMQTAAEAGAEAIALIPRCDGGTGDLVMALRDLMPMLADHGLTGLVEPLGFTASSLRLKRAALDAIDTLDASATLRLVHDTFHHHLSGEPDIFAAQTGIVHISGVTDPDVQTSEMTDAHRGLIDGADRLCNLDQIERLLTAGYTGPFSFEAFSPDFHALPDPVGALRQSMEFIRTRGSAQAA